MYQPKKLPGVGPIQYAWKMSTISWKYWGLDNPMTVQVLVDLVHSKKFDIIFLIEYLVWTNKLQPIKHKLGFKGLFVVDNVGHNGSLTLLWND